MVRMHVCALLAQHTKHSNARGVIRVVVRISVADGVGVRACA